MNLRVTEFLMKKNGYDTVKASSGAECLELLADGADLILLDVLMPGMNGFDVLKKIRASGDDIPVVFMTAAEDKITLDLAEKQGTACIKKPFKPDEIVDVVKRILG